MVSPIKTKTNTTTLNNKKEVNRLKPARIVKSNLRCEISSPEISNSHPENRKKSMKKLYRNNEERSGLKKIRNHNSKKSQSNKNSLSKKSRNKFNAQPCINLQKFYQNKISEKNSLKTFFKHSQDFNIIKGANQIFVSLDNIDDEKRSKHKFKNPASGSELKRMREKLWRKSSYHKRFLEKNEVKESQKSKKYNEEAVGDTKHPTPKRGNVKVHKSENKISTFNEVKEINENTNLEQNITSSRLPDRNGLGSGKAVKINQELQSPTPSESSKNDVSKVDENYLKSLLFIANCNAEQENMRVKSKDKDNPEEKEITEKMPGKEFFTSKMKNKKINVQLESKTTENNKTNFTSLPEADDAKMQQHFPKEASPTIGTLRDSTKSESQIKVSNRNISDIKNKEVKNKQKKSFSKHEINNNNNYNNDNNNDNNNYATANINNNNNNINNNKQKTKTRNVVKNKKEDKIEMPLPSGVLKTEDVQELWSRENVERVRNSQSSDFLTAAGPNRKGENIKDLGIESYQILKRFVEEEVYRISHKYNKNNSQENNVQNDSENGNKELAREQISIEKELPGLVRKKLLKKIKGNISRDENQLRNAETLNLTNVLEKEKTENMTSKLKLLAEKKSQNKRVPDEIIKNWSIVNRLEQAFLALGSPDFEKRVTKEPATTNAKGMRTTENNFSEGKRLDKKTKNLEESEKVAGAHGSVNKQINTDVNKSLLSEKQVHSSLKKDSRTSGRKPGMRSSLHSIKPSKGDAKAKSKDEKSREHPPSLTRAIKPPSKPIDKLNKKSGIKPPTRIGNICSLQSKNQGSRKTGKFGKNNSSRPNSCESSTQIKINDDNLERKKTFHIISLKDSVIMQPRRSKSCNKIERNAEVVRIRSISSTGSEERANLDIFNKREQNLEFWDFFNKIDKMKTDKKLNNKSMKKEQNDITHALKKTNSTDTVPARNSNQERKCEKAVPQELPEQVMQMKSVKHGSKVRPVKERSILSIRTNQPENQTSTTDLIQLRDNCLSTFFHADNLSMRKTKVQRGDAFQSSGINGSGTSCISTNTYDIPMPSTENSAKHIAHTMTDRDEELELLKRPSGSSSKSSLETLPNTSTDKKGGTKTIRNAPWEQDINHYRALVREIMSQYKRLGGFLKQSENVETLARGSEKLKAFREGIHFGNFKQGLNIQEYRKRIIQEYKKLPILEYKRKMQEAQLKPDSKRKRKKLLVVQTTNSETDLDVKDYEPSMTTILGSRLYFDKRNFAKKKGSYKNSKEKKTSLQEVILPKNVTPENSSRAISTPKSCLCYFKPTGHIMSQYKSIDKDKPQDFELNYVAPM